MPDARVKEGGNELEQALRDRLIDSLVGVSAGGDLWGMGFATSGKIVTAAHCIPAVPKAVSFWNNDRLPVEVRAFDQSEEVLLLLECYEPCHDIAILSDLSLIGSPPPDREAALRFLCGREWAPIFLGEHALNEPFALHIHTHDGRWVSGEAAVSNPLQVSLYIESPSGPIDGGTSGAPAFNKNGEVVGIVSSGDQEGGSVSIMRLATALPGRVLMALDENWSDYIKRVL